MNISLVMSSAPSERSKDVIPCRIETFELFHRRHSTSVAATCDEDDDVDRVGNQTSRNGDDGFLDQLLEPIEG